MKLPGWAFNKVAHQTNRRVDHIYATSIDMLRCMDSMVEVGGLARKRLFHPWGREEEWGDQDPALCVELHRTCSLFDI